MINTVILTKINDIMSDEQVIGKIQNANAEQTYQILVHNGLEATFEQFMSIIPGNEVTSTVDGEICEELLDMIDGGAKVYFCPFCSVHSTSFGKVWAHAVRHALLKSIGTIPGPIFCLM